MHLKFRAIGRSLIEDAVLVDLLPGGFDLVLPNAPRGDQSLHGRPWSANGEEGRYGAARLSCALWLVSRPDNFPDFADLREDRVVLYGRATDAGAGVQLSHQGNQCRQFHRTGSSYGESMYNPQLRARSAAAHLVSSARERGARRSRGRRAWPSAAVLAAVLLRFCRTLGFGYAPLSTAVYAARRPAAAADAGERPAVPLVDTAAQVSPDFVAALLLHEDRHFRWHLGSQPVALLRAASAHRQRRGAHQGGLHVTMQLARLHPSPQYPKRLPASCARSLAPQSGWSCAIRRTQILEAYVNLTPYGRNVQGVGAASLIYFGKPPHGSRLRKPGARR